MCLFSRETWFKNRHSSDADGDEANLSKSYSLALW